MLILEAIVYFVPFCFKLPQELVKSTIVLDSLGFVSFLILMYNLFGIAAT
jgi:hypothetical protein